MINIPLINVFFPQNAITVLQFFLIIANFDIPGLDMDTWFGKKLWDLPNDQILSDCTDKEVCPNLVYNLNSLDFNSCYISRNLESAFVILLGSLILLVFIIIPSRWMMCHKRLIQFSKYLQDTFLWGYYLDLLSSPILFYFIGGYWNLKYCNVNSESTAA